MNQKFNLALHILTYLDLECDHLCTSEQIAKSIQTNPVVVRRMLPTLKEAGFIETKRGQGGVSLLKRAEDINLYDVYALYVDQFVQIKTHDDHTCPVARHMYDAINVSLSDTESAIKIALQNKNIKDISKNILKNIQKENLK